MRIYISHRIFVLIMDFCLDFVFAIYLLRSLLCLWWYWQYSYLVRYYVFDVKWWGWKMNPEKQTNHSTMPIFWCTVCIMDHLARRLKDQYGWSVQIYIGTSFGKMLIELWSHKPNHHIVTCGEDLYMPSHIRTNHGLLFYIY